ncbi:MAG: tetratricopeptide repeat protein [Chlamydiales bacterium]
MTSSNWRSILGWTDEQIEELRFAGFSFLREGQYNKALLFFEALVIIDPSNTYDMQTLGALHLQMSNGKKAIEILNRALLLDPSHELTQLNKVKALLLSSEKNQAFALAKELEKSQDLTIANDVSALLTTYY